MLLEEATDLFHRALADLGGAPPHGCLMAVDFFRGPRLTEVEPDEYYVTVAQNFPGEEWSFESWNEWQEVKEAIEPQFYRTERVQYPAPDGTTRTGTVIDWEYDTEWQQYYIVKDGRKRVRLRPRLLSPPASQPPPQ